MFSKILLVVDRVPHQVIIGTLFYDQLYECNPLPCRSGRAHMLEYPYHLGGWSDKVVGLRCTLSINSLADIDERMTWTTSIFPCIDMFKFNMPTVRDNFHPGEGKGTFAAQKRRPPFQDKIREPYHPQAPFC